MSILLIRFTQRIIFYIVSHFLIRRKRRGRFCLHEKHTKKAGWLFSFKWLFCLQHHLCSKEHSMQNTKTEPCGMSGIWMGILINVRIFVLEMTFVTYVQRCKNEAYTVWHCTMNIKLCTTEFIRNGELNNIVIFK